MALRLPTEPPRRLSDVSGILLPRGVIVGATTPLRPHDSGPATMVGGISHPGEAFVSTGAPPTNEPLTDPGSSSSDTYKMSVEAARKDPFGLAGSVLDGRFRSNARWRKAGSVSFTTRTQVALDRPVAIKVLKTPADFDEAAKVQFRDRFAGEAKTIARIRHPHIVDVYDFGISPMPSGEIAPWMALEWLQGETLEDELQRRRGQGGRKPADVLAVLRPVLQAFAFAHKQGIAHRDIKPANIMTVPSEHGVTMQVLDFGIAKVANPDQIAGSGYSRTSSMPAFSPLYAAPEQIAFGRTGVLDGRPCSRIDSDGDAHRSTSVRRRRQGALRRSHVAPATDPGGEGDRRGSLGAGSAESGCSYRRATDGRPRPNY